MGAVESGEPGDRRRVTAACAAADPPWRTERLHGESHNLSERREPSTDSQYTSTPRYSSLFLLYFCPAPPRLHPDPGDFGPTCGPNATHRAEVANVERTRALTPHSPLFHVLAS